MYFTLNGASNHLTPLSEIHGTSSTGEWNQQNPGVGLELQKEDSGLVTSYMLGQYLNSNYNNTNYLGAQYQKRFGNENFHADVGALAGLATGYNMPVTPMLLPTLTIGSKYFDINARYTPKIEGLTPEVWMLNMDYKLK